MVPACISSALRAITTEAMTSSTAPRPFMPNPTTMASRRFLLNGQKARPAPKSEPDDDVIDFAGDEQ